MCAQPSDNYSISILFNLDRITIHSLASKNVSMAYSSGQWIDGKQMHRLENELKEYLEVPYIVLTNSGTSALFAVYWALRKEFTKLITDPYTFPATYQTAKVAGYDIKFTRWTPAKSLIFKKDSAKKNSVLYSLVHLFGQPNSLLDSFESANLIEDVAQAFGAKYKNKKVGTFGRAGIFSFYPTKTLHTCGHGGAIATHDKELYGEIKRFVECGRQDGIMTESPALNLRMDEIKAEFLLEELKSYDHNIKIQRDIANEFKRYVPKYQPFLEEDLNNGEYHIYSVFNLIVDRREEFRSFFNSMGIDTNIYYGSDMLPAVERENYSDLTDKIVSIPCRWNLNAEEIKRIATSLKSYFG